MNNDIYKAKQNIARHFFCDKPVLQRKPERQVLTCGEYLINKNFKNKQNEKEISKYRNLIKFIRAYK